MITSLVSHLFLVLIASQAQAFVPIPLQIHDGTTHINPVISARSNSWHRRMYFADVEESASAPESTTDSVESTFIKPTHKTRVQKATRTLGSQELLMLPRQYSLSQDTFPQMTHVCAVVLNKTPKDEAIFRQAVQEAMESHPLLNARIQGDGEPDRRIDMMQMVREGEPNPCTFVTDRPLSVKDVLRIHTVDDLEKAWQSTFVQDLDDTECSWCIKEDGPLWKLDWFRSKEGEKSALVFSLNHAISDQSSINRLNDQILFNLASLEEKGKIEPSSVKQEMPVAMEDSVLGLGQRWSEIGPRGFTLNTIKYVLGKAAEGAKNPVILPDTAKEGGDNPILGALQIISGKTAGGQDETSQERKTVAQFRTLSDEITTKLLEQCRANGVSMSNALTAAMTLTATDFVGNDETLSEGRNYKVLQSLDMRRFGEKIDKGETVACMAGSHDLMLGPFPDGSGKLTRNALTAKRQEKFWSLARESQKQTRDFIEGNGPQEAVRVFDFAMTISDLTNLVHLSAQSKDTLGRAYSAQVTNVGVYERQKAFPREGEGEDASLKIEHGIYKVEDVFFATPHTQSGCLFPLSCMTVNGTFKLVFHPMSPVVNAETNAAFADAFVDLIETVAKGETVEDPTEENEALASLKENALPLMAALIGAVSVATHAGAFAEFFNAVMEMKKNTDPDEFWPALNFWIFFAVGHPILQPILWISDVLHGTPGPMVGGLVPVLFLAGNAGFIAAFSRSKQFRTAVNIAALAGFFSYVGAGLDGKAGMGDFNLALDDSYKGEIMKGCPTYEQVRQPSMDNFDLEKYQGLWYEHKFHDWTQFKEVYDTTLGIKLTDGGQGWIDDFAVKGPAPKSAPLSWDKSPVANGAHYFLFGRVDPNDPPGILREKGFGVEFPNYIVDVQKNQETGEYTESIQFQCLERGGVRVFEGINFMSRSPTMTQEELTAMHLRAQKAGMYPYGASPEQMHTVARRPVDAPEIDNNWQAMWRAIGVDKLLELLTESIEDGGR